MKRSSLATALLPLVLGCAEAAKVTDLPGRATGPTAARSSPSDESKGEASKGKAARSKPPASPQPNSTLSSRKIIYTANIDLLVDNLSAAASKLEELLKEHQGILAQSDISSNSNYGSSKTASWRVRVPVSAFADFVKHVARLGEALNNKTESEDITDKYFDIQVRIEIKGFRSSGYKKSSKSKRTRSASCWKRNGSWAGSRPSWSSSREHRPCGTIRRPSPP